MTVKQRRITSIAIAITILGLSILGMKCCNKKIQQKREIQGIERIENAIGVSLPKDTKLEFHYYSFSPDGSFTQFTIFSFSEQPDDILNRYSLVEVTETWNTDGFVRYAKGQIKEEYMPSFNEPCLSNRTYFSSGTTCEKCFDLLYFPNSLKLIFFITFVS